MSQTAAGRRARGKPWESQPEGGRRFTSHFARRPTGRYEPSPATTATAIQVGDSIKLEEAVKTCLSRHQIPTDVTFGRAVEGLRPAFVQHSLGDTDWVALKDIITIRNWIVHHGPTPGYFEDPRDENSYIAVWEGKHGRLIQIADIDQAADDASRLASLVSGLRPISTGAERQRDRSRDIV